MKNILTLLFVLLYVGTLYAQDTIVFVDNTTVVAKVLTIEKSAVTYKRFDNLEGPTYTKNTTEISIIKYFNGSVDKFNASQEKYVALVSEDKKDFRNTNIFGRPVGSKIDRYANSYESAYANRHPEQELERLMTRQRRLRGWSKFLSIYGTVGLVAGTLCVISGSNEDLGYGESSSMMSVGIAACAEASVCFIISACLQGSRKRTLREIDAIYSNGIYGQEIKVGNCTIAPSMNLLSDKNTHQTGIGAGMKLTF